MSIVFDFVSLAFWSLGIPREDEKYRRGQCLAISGIQPQPVVVFCLSRA